MDVRSNKKGTHTHTHLQCYMLRLVPQSALTLTPQTVACQDPLSMGILQARKLEWVAMPSSRGSSQPRHQNPGLPHCRRSQYLLSHQGSPWILKWMAYSFSRGSSRPRIEPGSSALQAVSLPAELPGKLHIFYIYNTNYHWKNSQQTDNYSYWTDERGLEDSHKEEIDHCISSYTLHFFL